MEPITELNLVDEETEDQNDNTEGGIVDEVDDIIGSVISSIGS